MLSDNKITDSNVFFELFRKNVIFDLSFELNNLSKPFNIIIHR